MNTKANNDIKKYLSNLKSELPASYSKKKIILEETENSLELYAIDNPEYTYEDLVREFGEPAEVANALICDEPTDTIRKQMNSSSQLRIGVVLLFILTIFIVIGVIIYVAKMSTEHDIPDSGSSENVSFETEPENNSSEDHESEESSGTTIPDVTASPVSGKEVFTDEFCSSIEKIIFLNPDGTSAELTKMDYINFLCKNLQNREYVPIKTYSYTVGTYALKFVTSQGIYGLDYDRYFTFENQEYWLKDSTNFADMVNSYKEYATELSTASLSGKEVFPDEFCNSLEKIVYHNFDGTTIEITDSETLQEICQLLQEKTYTPYIQAEALYGWYSLEFVTQNGERSMAYAGNIINIERNFYQITNSAEFIEKLNSYKGN